MIFINTYQRLRKFILIVPVICLFASFVSAKSILLSISDVETAAPKNISIAGIVRDEDGKMIKDATVGIKGTRNSTVTSEKGAFKLTDVAIGSTLTITHSGYESFTFNVTGTPTFDVIILQKRNNANAETFSKKQSGKKSAKNGTSEPKYIEPDLKAGRDIAIGAKAEHSDAFFVHANDFEPDKSLSMQQRPIRFHGKFIPDLDKQPLYIIDEKIWRYSDVSYKLDTENIKSMIIVKDPQTLRKYGTAAKNGVIKIETKKK